MQEQTKVNLLGLDRQGLEAFFTEMGEKAFRASQLLKWMHQFGVDDFDEMTNMSKALRERLKDVAEIRAPEVVLDQGSSDGTHKWVLRMDSGNHIETVFIPDGERGTLCVSSQVGCALECLRGVPSDRPAPDSPGPPGARGYLQYSRAVR